MLEKNRHNTSLRPTKISGLDEAREGGGVGVVLGVAGIQLSGELLEISESLPQFTLRERGRKR